MGTDKDIHTEDNLKKILEYVSGMAVPSRITREGAWENLCESIRREEKKREAAMAIPAVSRRKLIIRYALAAVIVAILSVFYFFHFFSAKEYKTLRGRQLSFYLPDGSRVKLNSESTLTYNSYHWYKNRKVFLSGEALFEVEAGTPFLVCCDNCTVKVLGTTFNVFSRSNGFRVECVTGTVQVDVKNVEKTIAPGEALRYDNSSDSLVVYRFDVQSGGSWSRGEFYFNGEKLKHVFDEIERQYNIVITYPDINSRTYSGYFNSSAPMEQTLETVCRPMGLMFEISGRNVTIK